MHAPLLEHQAPGNMLSVRRLHNNCPVVGANLLKSDFSATPQLCKQPSMSNLIGGESGTVHVNDDEPGLQESKIGNRSDFLNTACCAIPLQ